MKNHASLDVSLIPILALALPVFGNDCPKARISYKERKCTFINHPKCDVGEMTYLVYLCGLVSLIHQQYGQVALNLSTWIKQKYPMNMVCNVAIINN